VADRRSNLAALAARQQRTETVTFIADQAPEALFCPIVSVDDHALEPATTFVDRVPAAMRDRVPHVEVDDDGLPRWVVDHHRLPILFANGAAGRVIEEWRGAAFCSYDDFRASVSDPVARLADMDQAGIWASLCFGSTLWGFAGGRFARMEDPEVGLASLRAWNDWMLEEWCGTDRDRYLPCQLPWMADPEVAADEVRRNAERGFTSVSFSENPEGLGFGSIYGGHWDPFFRACAETGTVVNLHVGSSGRTSNPSSASPPEVIAALFPLSGIETVVDWIYARIPVTHPDLKVVLSEAGLSWVPMVAERLRRAHRHVPASEVWSASDPDPVELLHRNFWFASLEDPAGFAMLDRIGADHVMVETDIPHMDSTWPGCQAMLRSEMDGLTPETIRKVAFENACELYRHPLPPAELVARADYGRSR
jgi:predicted TIM-barrel fold metal-dependent hydrolase